MRFVNDCDFFYMNGVGEWFSFFPMDSKVLRLSIWRCFTAKAWAAAMGICLRQHAAHSLVILATLIGL